MGVGLNTATEIGLRRLTIVLLRGEVTVVVDLAVGGDIVRVGDVLFRLASIHTGTVDVSRIRVRGFY